MPVAVLALLLTAGPAAAAGESRELVTVPDAILCLSAGSLDAANGRAASSQDRLRKLGCLRSPAGVPATLLERADAGGSLSVRFRPQGISDGVMLWGRPSAFTLADGTPLRSRRAER